MNIYVKSAIVAGIAIVGIYTWYRSSYSKLTVNRPPSQFELVDRMEKEGVPDFSLKRLDGSDLKLSDFRGKVVVINFWASWCNPCVEEFPSMLKLAEHYNGKLVILAVSTDELKSDIVAFVKAFGLPKKGFEVVWDEKRTIMSKYDIEKIPESFLVGKDGKLIRKILGSEDWSSKDALAYFDGLINESVSTQE